MYNSDKAHLKKEKLKEILRGYGSLAIAFSGGVDSTFLLKMAHDVLGDNCAAVTGRSESFPEREYKESMDFCRAEGIRQIAFNSEEIDTPGYAENPVNRCYICKHALFSSLLKLAEENGLKYVAEGSNTDDNGDFRPGLKAIAELGIKSPLREAGLTKEEIRLLSKEMELPTWDKPSYACLASRFVYGETITREKLSMVDRAEELLLKMGFRQVRVRIHDRIARIEVEQKDFERFADPAVRDRIYTELKGFGFSYVALDLRGYRTGSMNETLSEQQKRSSYEP
ncbi:MAG: ATP-dependent sacrificial sulfur transferase LarE [Lachnospiraceae bacterium]|nr:ATP-dependent sacrificial sulfur transferase LarE [Lachnospiraceae bacterium]